MKKYKYALVLLLCILFQSTKSYTQGLNNTNNITPNIAAIPVENIQMGVSTYDPNAVPDPNYEFTPIPDKFWENEHQAMFNINFIEEDGNYWPQQAKDALIYATDIWAQILPAISYITLILSLILLIMILYFKMLLI